MLNSTTCWSSSPYSFHWIGSANSVSTEVFRMASATADGSVEPASSSPAARMYAVTYPYAV
ncbi:MAG: hypothetical protein RI560_09335 [Natronomonas sp.]|nr:hypothetical protein [Natronomonas sp.]